MLISDSQVETSPEGRSGLRWESSQAGLGTEEGPLLLLSLSENSGQKQGSWDSSSYEATRLAAIAEPPY